MAWPIPRFSRSEVNRAGETLIAPIFNSTDYVRATEVLSNWRSCHGYAVNTFQATLRRKLATIDEDAIVAQRLKRTPSIVSKLQRYGTMRLSRMQDIGGLRAVVKDIHAVRALQSAYKQSRFPHQLMNEHDYIGMPKSSGYRSVHLVYKYRNEKAREYDGLLLELQIRTRLQHAWATAVETVGTFLDQSLKSSEGPDAWLEFFALTSSAFSHVEIQTLVPQYVNLSKEETFSLVAKMATELGVREKLVAFTVAADSISLDTRKGSYHLVTLNASSKTITVQSFSKARLAEANMEYTRMETRITGVEGIQAVLVSTNSIAGLRRAYPNFFLDTHEFINQLNLIAPLDVFGSNDSQGDLF